MPQKKQFHKLEDRITMNMVKQAKGNREFHQILQDVTHLKRDVACISEETHLKRDVACISEEAHLKRDVACISEEAHLKRDVACILEEAHLKRDVACISEEAHLKRDVACISEGIKNENGSYEKVPMTSLDPGDINKRHKSLTFEEQTCLETNVYTPIRCSRDIPETMLDTENVKRISGEMLDHYSIMLQDNKELRKSSGYALYSDLCAVRSPDTTTPHQLDSSDHEAEPKPSQEKRKDNFECTFCGEEFELGDVYRTHVIEEHYNKSIGTFWNQRCFQNNPGSG